ncbi:MAG: c-type cytochrome [Acidobacteria bacterium]|nr:c-type cytochrome [Acidobacteriota bacterium]
MGAFSLPENEIFQLVSFIRSLNASAIDQEVAGDLANGELLFFGKARCGSCHMIRGQGGLVGPDLTDIGSRRTLEVSSISIRAPSSFIEPCFRSATVQVRNGQSISGVVKNDSNYSIQIQDLRGNLHLFLKRELEEVTYYQRSLMPVPSLSKTEMQNLLAFLSKQSPSRFASPSKRVEQGREKEP